ncbi:MAG: hypothetical protein KBT68_04390, partial [bacterium]|nr:hypothetical protein [Candidatus Colisoma equi]
RNHMRRTALRRASFISAHHRHLSLSACRYKTKMKTKQGKRKMKRMLTVLAAMISAAAVQLVQAAGERGSSQRTTDEIAYETRIQTSMLSQAIPYDTASPGLFIVVQ